MKLRTQKVSQKRRITGQGMSEYLIIVGVIAVAAIGVTSLTGNVVKNQIASIANELGGTDAAATQTAATTAGNDAATNASTATDLSNFASSN